MHGIRPQAISAYRGVGSTYSVQRRRVTAASALQRDCAHSTPAGWVDSRWSWGSFCALCSTADVVIRDLFKQHRVQWRTSVQGFIDPGHLCAPGLAIMGAWMSNTWRCSPLISTCAGRDGTPPEGVWESTLRAPRMFPRSINFVTVKPRRAPSSFLAVAFGWLLLRRCSQWMARHSSNESVDVSGFPDRQTAPQAGDVVTGFGRHVGFWSKSRGVVDIAAVKANDSSCEPSA